MPIVGPVFLLRDTLESYDDAGEAELSFNDDPFDEAVRAYDSEGRLLKVTLEPQPRTEWRAGKLVTGLFDEPLLKITLAEDEPSHSEELHRLIVDWLSRDGGSPEELNSASLPELEKRWREYEVDVANRPMALTEKAAILVILWPFVCALAVPLLQFPAIGRHFPWLLTGNGKTCMAIVAIGPPLTLIAGAWFRQRLRRFLRKEPRDPFKLR